MKKLIKSNLLAVTLMVAIGTGLRFNVAINQSFWRDEVSVFNVSRMRTMDLLLLRYEDKSHPQLYYLFQHFWQKTGTSPLYLRLPSLFSSSLTLILIYLIGKLIINHKFGLLSSLNWALNPFFINLDFQAKFYSFEIFFVIASIYFLLRYLNENRLKWALISTFFNVIAFYIDYSFLWYFGSLALTALLSGLLWKKNYATLSRSILTVCLLTTVLISTQLFVLLRDIPQILQLERVRETISLVNIDGSMREFTGFFGYTSFIFTYILLFFSVTYILKYISQKGIVGLFFLFIFIAGSIPLLVAYGFSQIVPILNSRNLWISGLLFIFGIPAALSVSTNRSRLTYSIWGLYLLFLFITSISMFHYFVGKTNWKTLADLTNIYKNQQIFLVFLDYEGEYWYRIGPLRDYYLAGYDKDFNIKNYRIITISPTDAEFTDKLTSLSGEPAVWLLYSGEFLNWWSSSYRDRAVHYENIQRAQKSMHCDDKPCKNVFFIFD